MNKRTHQKDIVDLDNNQALKQALQNLSDEQETERDLWPDIQARLGEQDKVESQDKIASNVPQKNNRWLVYALAASVMICCGTLWFSWNHLQSAKMLNMQSQQLANVQSSNTIKAQIRAMEKEYRLAKSVLLSQINTNTAQSNPELVSEIEGNLIVIEQATNELKAAIALQPEDPTMLKLLNATYQQELAVLSELAKLNTEPLK